MPRDFAGMSLDKRVDAATYRQTMGKFATGVAIVTAVYDGVPFGMTVNSLTSVSLDPCLLLICPKRDSATGIAIRESRRFAVNILAADQRELCMRFVGQEAARFDGLDLPEAGLPLLPDCLAHITCRLADTYPGGDHDILLGEVESCQARDGTPLLFHEGQFCECAT